MKKWITLTTIALVSFSAMVYFAGMVAAWGAVAIGILAGRLISR